MASQDQALLKEAIVAIQAGRLDDARRILAGLLRQDPENVDAWVWLGKAVDDPAKRKDCFSRALRLDPNNAEARRGMVALLSGPQPEAQPEAGAVAAPAGERPTHISAYPSPCPQCGAHLRYDVPTRALRCEHCGTQRPVPQPTRILTWPGLPPDMSVVEAQTEPIGRDTLRCRSCGAITELSRRTASLSCLFCGSPQVVQSKGGAAMIPPQAIIPFEVDQPQAVQALRDWLGQGLLRPEDLAEKAEITDLNGTYLPFWAFKGLGKVSYQMEGSGYSAPLGVPANQEQHVTVEDVLLPASYRLEAETLHAIEPFNLNEAIPFRPEYLAGWPAEVYQTALADATIQARERMSKQARNKAEAMATVMIDSDSYGVEFSAWGSPPASERHQREVHYRVQNCTIHLDSSLHLMLPVWQGAYRYRGRTYSFAINGQTGQVGGEAPRSAAMTALTVVYAVVGVGIVGILIAYFWPAIYANVILPIRTILSGAGQGDSTSFDLIRVFIYAVVIIGPTLILLSWLIWRWIVKVTTKRKAPQSRN